MCMQNIDHTLSWDGYDLSYFTHVHFRIIQNNIMVFIGHFWCRDFIWTTWTWYVFCAGTITTKFGKPLLNHSIRQSRVRIIFIELGLGFWYGFSIVINQDTKFTCFYLCKKFGGWLLSDTVICKLMNGFGSNFDKRSLKDGTFQQW